MGGRGVRLGRFGGGGGPGEAIGGGGLGGGIICPQGQALVNPRLPKPPLPSLYPHQHPMPVEATCLKLRRPLQACGGVLPVLGLGLTGG